MNRTAEQYAADAAASTFDEATGRWLDPVTGRLLPKGTKLLPDPDRNARRRLEAWRADPDRDTVPSRGPSGVRGAVNGRGRGGMFSRGGRRG